MSIRYMNWVWRLNIPSNMKIVLLAISDCADDEGFAYPGYDTLIYKTSLSRSTLAKQLKLLDGSGLLDRASHASIGQGRKVNTYTINIDKYAMSTRGELTDSSRDELKDRIKELQESLARPLSSSLVLGKVQPSVKESMRGEHEPSVEPSVKEPPAVDFPKQLNEKAWNEYIKYRREAKFKKLTPTGQSKQIATLISYGGHSIQRACVDKTIANGWQGIFPLNKSELIPMASADTSEWYQTATGIKDKGKELGVYEREDEGFPYFKARVFKKCGLPLDAK